MIIPIILIIIRISWDLRYQLVNFSFLFEQKVHLVLVHQGILLSGSFHPRLCFIASSYFLLVLTFKIVMYILLDFYFIDITIFIRWFWNLNISLIRWLWICSCIWSQFMFLCNLIIFFYQQCNLIISWNIYNLSVQKVFVRSFLSIRLFSSNKI